MTAVSALLVRIALLHLLVGSTIGALLLASKGFYFWSWLGYLRPFHYELLLFGWMVNLVFGVASWILPRTAARKRDEPLYLALVLLNVGVLLAAFGAASANWLPLLAGRLLEIGAVATFAWYIWPRIRSFVG